MDDLVTLGCGRDQRPGLLLCDRDKDVSRPVGQADDEPVVVAIEMKNNNILCGHSGAKKMASR
jgi:hypothetical protein